MRLGRHRHKRVGAPTAARGLLLRPIGRAHLTVPPCRVQSGEELLQRRRRGARRFGRCRTVGDVDQLLLRHADHLQQSNWIQSHVGRGHSAYSTDA